MSDSGREQYSRIRVKTPTMTHEYIRPTSEVEAFKQQRMDEYQKLHRREYPHAIASKPVLNRWWD